MSRIAKQPVEVPSSVELSLDGHNLKVKGAIGSLEHQIHQSVAVVYDNNRLNFAASSEDAWPQAGTERMLVHNMLIGVTQGFEKKLRLVGVGYRAQIKSNKLNLALGFSHDINVSIPADIAIEVPSATEIVVKGADKQKVGQIAAIIRSYRPPEPYKGKGVRYDNEQVRRKEVKKTK